MTWEVDEEEKPLWESEEWREREDEMGIGWNRGEERREMRETRSYVI